MPIGLRAYVLRSTTSRSRYAICRFTGKRGGHRLVKMASGRLTLGRDRNLSDNWEWADADLFHTVEVFLKHQAGATAATTEWLHEIYSHKPEPKEKAA